MLNFLLVFFSRKILSLITMILSPSLKRFLYDLRTSFQNFSLSFLMIFINHFHIYIYMYIYKKTIKTFLLVILVYFLIFCVTIFFIRIFFIRIFLIRSFLIRTFSTRIRRNFYIANNILNFFNNIFTVF